MPMPPPSLSPVAGRKALVVGWDGADWQIIKPLLEAGRMPNLRRLLAEGAELPPPPEPKPAPAPTKKRSRLLRK